MGEELEYSLREILVSLADKEKRILIEKMGEEKKPLDFAKSWDYSDAVFVAEGQKVYANKMILCLWSPVIEAMFTRDFKEKTSPEIKLPGKKFADVVELMHVLHPPNKEIDDDNVDIILPLAHEYQIDKVLERCERALLSQASSVKNFLVAQRYGLKKLADSNLSYLKRAPVSRLRSQAEFEQLDREVVLEVLTEKCEKFESNVEALREIRMVLERKKPTTFPGMHLLCEACTAARDQQVDCASCMKSCCKKITEILREMER